MRARWLACVACAVLVATATGCLQLLELDDAVRPPPDVRPDASTAWAEPVLVIVDADADADARSD